jgi:hypothetical protein
MCDVNETLDVESIRSGDAARRRSPVLVEVRRAREDPQILAVRRSDHRP